MTGSSFDGQASLRSLIGDRYSFLQEDYRQLRYS